MQQTRTKNEIAAFTLLGDPEILHCMGIEKIPDHHFCLRLAIGVTLVGQTDIHPDIQERRQLVNVP